MSDRKGLCAYVITRHGDLELGPPLRLIGHRRIGLVVAEVDPARFEAIDTDGPADGDLVELARTHDAVTREVFRCAPVLPLRFGTVLADEAAAVTLLKAAYDQALSFLDELDGHREWGVRLCLAKPKDESEEHSGLTGTEYLLRRRERLAGVRRAQEDAARAVDRLHGRLLAHATRSVERSSGRHASAEHAYLVAVDREPLFHNEIDRLAGELAAGGITVERTGPWPPYSFVDIELEARAHA